MPKFEAAIASAFRLRNSMLAEVLLLAFVYGVGILVIWRQYVTLDASTWYATPSAGGPEPSWAGRWYGWVSMPIFQFLLCRWYFRLFIWARFLWQVSRIELRLVPTHPDRVGGLSFLSETPLLFPCSPWRTAPWWPDRSLAAFSSSGRHCLSSRVRSPFWLIFMLCVVLGPLLLFTPQLFEAKWKGLREYGTLAGSYVREFDAKWLRRPPPANETFMGSADIQSLADLGNSYEVVRSMRIAPISNPAVLGLVAATLLPIAPLLLTMMPLEELLKKLSSILF